MRVALFLLFLAQDPADELRRQELRLRLADLAESGKYDGFSRSVLRELRGRRVDAPSFDRCWRAVTQRSWDGKLETLIEAWDKAAAAEAPAPGAALFRVKLDVLANRPKPARERLEEALRRFPGEPVLLWTAARLRFDDAEYERAARALEEAAASKEAAFDVDEFHRLLVRCYAETGRPAAAVEHLRAIREAAAEPRDLALLAARCRLHGEAARYYRLAMADEPERASLRLGLISQLAAAGESAAAAAERRKIFEADGAVRPVNVEEYFYLLAPEGRAAEIVSSLRQLFETQPDPAARMALFAGLARTVPGECRGSVMTEWEKTETGGFDWAVLGRMKRLWGPRADAVETLSQAEKLYPKDPWIPREQMEAYSALDRIPDLNDAYARLQELDPEARLTGPRPYLLIVRLLENLMARDAPAAFAVAFRSLELPGLDDDGRKTMRKTLNLAWDRVGTVAWDQVRKAKLPAVSRETEEAARAAVEKLSADDFETRSAASAELRRLGSGSLPVLLRHLDDPDAEVRSRVRTVLRALFTD